MKNETQKIAMYVALGAAITMLVLYFSGQLRFIENMEEEETEEYEEGEEEDGVEAYEEGDSDSDSESEAE